MKNTMPTVIMLLSMIIFLSTMITHIHLQYIDTHKKPEEIKISIDNLREEIADKELKRPIDFSIHHQDN